MKPKNNKFPKNTGAAPDGDLLTPDEGSAPQADDTDVGTKSAARDERLQAFGSTMASTRDKWVRARAATGWDKRVNEDIDLYHSKDAANKAASNMMDSVEQGYPVMAENAKVHRSTLFVGITRQKTNASEARLADILLPTDDRNWGIQPTPDPEGAEALESSDTFTDPATGQPILMDESGNVASAADGGKPVPKKKIAQAAQWMAHKAAQAMQMEIDNQLVICDYNAEVRKMLHTSAVMGTGVLKGPVVMQRVKKAWREQTDVDPNTGRPSSIQVMELIKELTPTSVEVDPRYVWEDPGCGDDVKNGQGIFELNQKSSRQVKELAKQPGYLIDQLRAVIEEGPQKSAALNETRQQIDDHNEDTDKIFQHWIYWGELERDDLEAAGVTLPADADDPLESFCGCIEMINDKVVRAFLNPLEDSPIPYDFFPWERVQGSPRGYGMPYMMRPQQSVTNAAWRQLMDNSGITAGPQIVIKQNAITPADGSWQLSPMKYWYMHDENMDVNKAFASFEFASHQEELSAIIELAEKLGDQETATPMMAQGQQGSAPDTVGGMTMLMNSANVVLRRQVKQFDDCVTKPHIKRYYDYNMLYSEKDEIKGDFNIDARGSSALVIRDIQNQAFTNLLASASNPSFAPMINMRELFTKALQAQHIDPEDIMYTEDQVAANAAKMPPQPPTALQVAEVKVQSAEKIAIATAQARQAEVQQRTASEVADRQLRVQELSITRDIAVMEAASREKVSVQQINADLAQASLADRTRKEIEAANISYAEGNPAHHGVASVAPQTMNK